MLEGPVRGLYRLFGGFHASGAENVPAKGGCILASNHLSWADPPAVRIGISRPCWFMANDFLFRIPVLGWVIRFFNAFPVRRGVLDREAIRQADKLLQEGEAVVIFPEGGTTITGRLVPFEGGPAMLALRNNVPVVPVGLAGTDKVLPREPSLPRWARGGTTVVYGRPIHPDDIDPSLPRRERMDLLTERLYWAVHELSPAEYRAAPDEPKGIVGGTRPDAATGSLNSGAPSGEGLEVASLAKRPPDD